MIWWPRQMPKIGTSPSRPARHRGRRPPRRGRPGPFERNTPSGSRPSTSAAGVDAGTTSTRQPAATRWVRIVRLIPRSYATTRYGASSSPDHVRLGGGDLGDEVDAVGGSGRGRGRGAHRGFVGAERAGQRAGVAQVAGQAAGVDAGDRRARRTLAGRRRGRRCCASCSGGARGRARSTPRQNGRALS